MKKNWKKYIVVAIILLTIAGGIFFFLSRGKKSTMVLNVTEVKRGDISTSVTATGTVEPITLVEVGTQVSGVISRIYVDYNSEVKEGQVLAELDKRLLLSELENAEATLQTRQVELENQQRTYDRYKELWNRQAISKADWETVETAYETAQLAVTASRSAVFRAQTNLGYATIYSTIDGVVISRDVEEGQTVAASFSTPTLFTIANDLTKMQVVANVDEADIGQVEEGQRVTFTVDAYPNDIFEGEVIQVRLEATVTSNVVTYEVVIDAPNPDLKLKPGLTANVNIYNMEKNDVMLIPSRSTRFTPEPSLLNNIRNLTITPATDIAIENNNQKIVWLKSDNNLTPRLITIGDSDGINTEVTGGLNIGEMVVTGVSQQLPEDAGDQNGETNPFMPQRPSNRRR